MDRRDFLTGAVTTVIGLSAAASAKRATAHEGHGGLGALGAATARDPKLAKIVETSLDCVKTGDACTRHCVEQLAKGDTTLAECMQAVLDLTAVCASMAQVASHASEPTKTLRAYVAACAQYCRDCSAACKKHADHHEACKLCMESCDRCVASCEALAT